MAHKFAHDMLLVEGAKLHAVASRDEKRAKDFATTYKATSAYDSYESLANDKNVDVVYIATHHCYHYEHSMLCLKAGRGVICEKPFAVNSKQVQEMINEAVKKKLFLMEAMWTRFIPATEKVLEMVKAGVIGDIVEFNADFGFVANPDPERRLFNRKLGGGSLLDIGIYPVFVSLLLLGEPESIEASATIAETGVDSECIVKLQYNNGVTASFECSFLTLTPTDATIQGSKGAIYIYPRFHHSEKITANRHDTEDLDFDIPYVGYGYYHEILEVVECMRQGLIESPKMTHENSLQLINTLDRIREIVGVRYAEDD